MSEHMESAVENIEKLIEVTGEEDLKQRLEGIKMIIIQNRKKIWLRTKTGRPLALEMEKASADLLGLVRSKPGDMAKLISEIEVKAKNIEEETRRRSMVVT